jgi:hypothetical protein
MTYRDDVAAAAALRAAQQRAVEGRLPELAELRVAQPCLAPWDEMRGEAHVRHCGRCDKDVFDLSGMTRQEIADLLYRRGADLCARFYRRSDGTIMTADCVDARRLGMRRRIGLGAAAAGIAGVVATAAGAVIPPEVDRVFHADNPAPSVDDGPVPESDHEPREIVLDTDPDADADTERPPRGATARRPRPRVRPDDNPNELEFGGVIPDLDGVTLVWGEVAVTPLAPPPRPSVAR